jgi:hypothetical protein
LKNKVPVVGRNLIISRRCAERRPERDGTGLSQSAAMIRHCSRW